MQCRFSCLVALVLLGPCLLIAHEPPDSALLLKWHRELKPLPKVHYSWPLAFDKTPRDLLLEYVRITHAASITGEWSSDAQIEKAVRLCRQVNETKPKILASIGVNFSVWHRRFGKELPPTDRGKTHTEELNYLRTRMQAVKNAVAAANEKLGGNVQVSAVLFDSERFHVRNDDERWNQAITEKYNAAYDLVRELFPQVRIEWYARGAIHTGASATGWSPAPYFTLQEKGDSYGCSLYQVPEIGYTRGIFRRTADNAEKHGVQEVTPWIALASGYRRQTNKHHEWSFDWDYDLIYSWQLGREINHPWFGAEARKDRFAPWNRAKIAIFYPEPYARCPAWGRHFVAYVRGAHGIEELPE